MYSCQQLNNTLCMQKQILYTQSNEQNLEIEPFEKYTDCMHFVTKDSVLV